MPDAPRLRQAVLAARDLDRAVAALRDQLGLGEPFHDPAVAMFGLRNAVFAIGDTFLEIVSPTTEDASAARLLNRRATDGGGYMVMFQVPDLPAARDRAEAAGVRLVFEVELDDISEVHLHPADMGGAIVALSAPTPPESWRWGGPGWQERSVPGQVKALTLEHPDPDAVKTRWNAIVGDTGAVSFRTGDDRGPVEIQIERKVAAEPIEIGSARITPIRPT